MALSLEVKKAMVAQLAGVASAAVSAVVVDYRGATVSQMTALRSAARSAGVQLKVCRNTLATRAVEGTEYACLTPILVGPVLLLFSEEEPCAAARLVRDFIKSNKDVLAVKGLAVSGTLLSADQLDAVASLPSREEALARLASVMQAPVVQFVRTLKEPVAQAVRAFGAVSDQKKAA